MNLFAHQTTLKNGGQTMFAPPYKTAKITYLDSTAKSDSLRNQCEKSMEYDTIDFCGN